MHKKVISIFAAAMVLGGLLAVGTISPAVAATPFAITNFHPTDDTDAASATVPAATTDASVLSDRQDGTNTSAHLTAVTSVDTTRVEWYVCPEAMAAPPATQAALATCGVAIATSSTPRVPAGGGGSVDEAYDAEWNIPSDLDNTDVTILSLACIGTGTRVETTGGLTANCIGDLEDEVGLEDAQVSQTGTTAVTQTSAGEIVSYCTSDVDGVAAGDDAGGDQCEGVVLYDTNTLAQVDARYKAFPHGSPIPNDGFLFRATTDPNVVSLSFRLFATADASGIDDTFFYSAPCTGFAATVTSQLWECMMPTASMTTLTNREAALQIFDTAAADGSGWCIANTTDPDAVYEDHCQLDSHYVVSGDRKATTTTFSFQPSTVQPGAGASDGSPATNAGCTPGGTETPDSAEDQPLETDIWGTLCVIDQFLNPLAGGAVTFEGTGADPGAEVAGCGTGEALPARGDGDGHDEHGPSTTNNSRYDDCHTALDATGQASVRLANYSTGTGAITAVPGLQTVTGCVENEYDSAGDQTNQPAGHGCTNESAATKATGTVNWLAVPNEVHTFITGTGGTADPCHDGANVATRQIGQNVDVTICTGLAGLDPHFGATTNQPNGGRLKYTLASPTGGQTQLATNLLSQPTETDAAGRATASLVCLRNGTDNLTVTLVTDADAPVDSSFVIQISCVAAGEPTATGSASATATATATATSTATSTVTTSPSTTATTPKTPRTVSLEVSRSPVSFGKEFALTGGVSSSVAACASGVTVTIRRTVVGQSAQEVVNTLTTNSDGTFSTTKTGDKSAQYIASVDDGALCAGATSTPAPVLVKMKVILQVSSTKIRSGQTVTLKVAVTPCDDNHAGTKVTYFKSAGGSFAKFASKTLNGDCKNSLKVKPGKDTVFQARYAKQDDDHLGGKSRKKVVKVS